MPDELIFMMGNFAARFPTDRRYTLNHMWLRAEGDSLRFGLSAYAIRLLREVYFLEWSVDAGATVRQKDEIGAIESSKAVAAIYAPADGTITRFNAGALADPSAINKDGYDAGWLFEMAAQAGDAMEPAQYLQYLETSWTRAQALLRKQTAQ
ncbi:MAG: glycine cleavage system protein H [Verrucomicrobia bacterium]|nr:glycine cleavage system protein H [Verrucomicrobiota bacterium]